MKLLAKADAIFDKTVNILAFLAGTIVVLVMLSIFMEVVLRKFFNISQPWVVEIGAHAILYIAFFGATWLLKSDGHVKMDLLTNRLKLRPQAMLNAIMSIVGALICLLLSWLGVLITVDLFQRSIFYPMTLELPMGALVAVIGPGSFLLSIQFLKRAYGSLMVWKRKTEPMQPVVEETVEL
jgi:TRAP-type C4-dicarboxylate transport system permease small subunit